MRPGGLGRPSSFNIRSNNPYLGRWSRKRVAPFVAGKTFLVASAVAAFLVVGTAVAYFASTEPGGTAFGGIVGEESSCGKLTGAPLDAEVEDSGLIAGARPTRTVVYTVDATGLQGGVVFACTEVGDVEVVAGGPTARLVFEISSSKRSEADRVRDAVVDAAFREGQGLEILAEHDRPDGEDDGSLVVDVRLEVPPSGAYAVTAATGVGDVRVQDLLLRETSLTTGVGDVTLEDGDATGSIVATSGVGDVHLLLSYVETADIAVETGVGNLMVELPARPDTGYRATGTTGIGSVVLDLPGAHAETKRDEMGGSASASTQGYDAKPTRVAVQATTGTGDVRVFVA